MPPLPTSRSTTYASPRADCICARGSTTGSVMTTKRSRDLRVRRSVIDATDQRVGIELDDDGGSAIEVAESNPCWTYSHVHEAGPGSACATVRPRLVVGRRHALQLQSLRLIGDALVLCGALVTLHDTADDE